MRHCQQLCHNREEGRQMSHRVTLFCDLTQFTQIKKSFNNEQKIAVHSQLGCKRRLKSKHSRLSQALMPRERTRVRQGDGVNELKN